MSSGPLHDRQAELRAEREDARARVSELEAADRRARRSVDAARAPLLDYLRACEAEGSEPDPAEIARLEAPVREASSRMGFEPAYANDPETGTPRMVGVDPYDSQARARLEGARQRLEEAERLLLDFEQEEWVGLLEELAQEAGAAADEWLRAARELRDASRALSTITNTVMTLGTRTGAFPMEAVPGTPLPLDALRALDEAIGRGPVALVPLPVFLLDAAGETEE